MSEHSKMPNKRFTLFEAFACAMRGIMDTAHERNFKIELGFMVLCIILGFIFEITLVEWLVVLVCFGLVLGGECFNTALEAIVDLASPDYHELARLAKDAAAGAVLLFSLASLAVGICIFAPRIFELVGIF
ncbi:MAG: diacylglycerol kinase family protein [Eggerthellaceae bacterium]